MRINNYIDFILTSKKDPFKKLEFDDSFDKNELKKLCNLKIKKKRLIVAWSLIIDILNDNLSCEKIQEFFTEDVLNFLIDNEICLCDLGHLILPVEYLEKIYEKDNSCWEALENIKIIHKTNALK